MKRMKKVITPNDYQVKFSNNYRQGKSEFSDTSFILKNIDVEPVVHMQLMPKTSFRNGITSTKIGKMNIANEKHYSPL